VNGFEDAAHEAFEFLCSEAGFRCAKSEPDLVRYESGRVFFEVSYAVDYDYCIDAYIGRFGVPGLLSEQSDESISFGLFLAVADPVGDAAIHREVPYYIANSPEQVRHVLMHFAAGLRSYGQALLSADEIAYSRARELRFWHAPNFPYEGPWDPQ
jgi:hypothetical protein